MRFRIALLVLILLVSLVTVFFLTGDFLRAGQRNVRTEYHKEAPTVADNSGKDGQRSNNTPSTLLKSGQGTVEVTITTSCNMDICIVVFQSKQIEKQQWGEIVSDPETNRKYWNSSIKVEGLVPGQKTLLLISGAGYMLARTNCEIAPEKVTEVSLTIPSSSNKRKYEIFGIVKDSTGSPIEGANLSIEEIDPASSIDDGGESFELASYEKAWSIPAINEGDIDSDDPYSKEYLDSLMEPFETPGSWFTTGFRCYSDGKIHRYNVTAENGHFRFYVSVDKPYVIIAEFAGISKNAIAQPNIATEITIETNKISIPSFVDVYRSVMRALLLKDHRSYETVKEMLTGGSSSEKMEQEYLKFIELFQIPFDFYDTDLVRRNSQIKTFSRFAYSVAQAVRRH